jgi:hypothetical protein
MKKFLSSAALASCALLAGCSDMWSESAAARTATTGAAGIGGAGLGYAISDGDPVITAASGVGAMALTQIIQGDDTEYGKKMMRKGIEYGTGMETKRLYFAMLNANKGKSPRSNQQLRYFEITVPAREVNGMKFDAEVIQVPIFDAVTPAANGAIGNPNQGRMVDGQTDILRPNEDSLSTNEPSGPVTRPQGR